MNRNFFISSFIVLLTGSFAPAREPLLERDVLPILKKNCMGCHGGLRRQSGLDLRTLPAMLKGGEGGAAVVRGDAAKSALWQRIVSDEMPPGKNRSKLSAVDKATIKAWINAGFPTVAKREKNTRPFLAGNKQHSATEVAQAIDKHIVVRLTAGQLRPVRLSHDVEFMRRLYLDLTGRVPTASQATAFLDSKDKDKRAKLIDQLLATPEFGQQFGRTWKDWICPPELPSTGNAGIQPFAQARALGEWLGQKFAKDESWDKITRQILTVTGDIKKQPQVIFFGLVGKDGRTRADGSARAVAKLFMGVQLQCARCHDDPYRDWSQKQHWGLTAFFGRASGDFKKITANQGPNRGPGRIVIPKDAFKNRGKPILASFPDGQAFPAKKNVDLRAPFVDWLVKKDNPFFARSFVNRVWFHLFGRGIVNPIDDFRALNPPTHPGLLQLLSAEFQAGGFRAKHLFRSICNSQAYQRTSQFDPRLAQPKRDQLTRAFGRMPLRVMKADMLYDSLELVFGEKLDLRTSVKHATVGMAAPVADPFLEFHRKFDTNEEDATDFTHGIGQMLTMMNHPRLLQGSKRLDQWLSKPRKDLSRLQTLAKKLKVQPDSRPPAKVADKKTKVTKPPASLAPAQIVGAIEWLYLTTLSRRPDNSELREAASYANETSNKRKALAGVLWMLVNRSEYLLHR